MTDENVRVVRGDPTVVAIDRDRSPALKMQDELLTQAAEDFTEARQLIDRGLEALTVLGIVPQHRNLPTLISQQIEQVAEVRRVRQ